MKQEKSLESPQEQKWGIRHVVYGLLLGQVSTILAIVAIGLIDQDIDLEDPSLEITAIGYAAYSKELAINDSELVIIELEQSTLKFSPIDVIADQSRLSGSGQNYYRLPGSISLISKAEVLEFNDTDINRVIGQVPGVYTQEEDGYGLRPNIGMRGTGLCLLYTSPSPRDS